MERRIEKSEKMQLNKFVETIIQKNLRNSVFVDVTANAKWQVYEQLLSKAFQWLHVIKLQLHLL